MIRKIPPIFVIMFLNLSCREPGLIFCFPVLTSSAVKTAICWPTISGVTVIVVQPVKSGQPGGAACNGRGLASIIILSVLRAILPTHPVPELIRKRRALLSRLSNRLSITSRSSFPIRQLSQSINPMSMTKWRHLNDML